MFIAIVTIFSICWLPYHLFYVYSYHRPHITSSNYVPHLFLAFYWLAMSNSMVNPIIYYWYGNYHKQIYHLDIINIWCYLIILGWIDGFDIIFKRLCAFVASICGNKMNCLKAKRFICPTQCQLNDVPNHVS